jgi:hypothetical protein
LASGSFNGTAADEQVAEGAQTGNWTVTVELNETVGTITIGIAAYAASEPEAEPTGDSTPGDNATADNGTALGNQTADSGGFGIPGFELAALVGAGAIAMALAARRRR